MFIEAVKSLNMPDLPFIGLLSGPANFLRNMVTKDPGFMLANMVRDSMAAYVTSGVKMTPVADTIRNFGKAMANTSPEYEALLNAGILGGYEFSQNIETSAEAFERELKKKYSGKSTFERLLNPMTAPRALWEALEKGTTASDAATRIEVYKRTLAETKNEAEALHRALEVMNFNRKGSSAVVRILTAAIPFLNARMQGLDVLYRAGISPTFRKYAYGEKPADRAKAVQKAFIVRGLTMAALSAMYWTLTHDDEEYKRQEQETKDNNWLMPNPVGKGFIKFATPFEVGFLFKTIPEVMVRSMMGTSSGKEAIASIQKGLIQNLPGGGVIFSQAVKPAVEVITNHSFFTGNPVESIGDQGKSIANRGQRASETAKMLSRFGLDKIGLSPAKIDHLIQGYFAELGTFTTSAVDTLIYEAEGKTPPAKNFESMQALKPFLTDRNVNKAVSDFYEIEKSAREVVTDLNDMKKKGMIKDIQELVGDEEKLKKVAIEPMLRKTMEGMAKIRAQIGYLRENEAGMTAEARRDRINELTQYMNQYAAQGVKAAKAMGLR
jgi:hypothetical protein